jgi:hypothetical protein
MVDAASEGADPARHLLRAVHPDGSPIPLDDEAARLQQAIAAARTDEVGTDNDWRSGVVVISSRRARAIADLLDELAVRLRPGLTVGPIQAERSLAELAASLSWHLHGQRSRSMDGE